MRQPGQYHVNRKWVYLPEVEQDKYETCEIEKCTKEHCVWRVDAGVKGDLAKAVCMWQKCPYGAKKTYISARKIVAKK